MKTPQFVLTSAVVIGLSLGTAATALAHCDGLDGPVVKSAQKALESGDIDYVLIWVSAADEAEVRAAFEQARAVRVLNAESKAVADRFFFETVVRVHRVAEGASFTGLKPAGRDLGPAIPAADRALEDRSSDALMKLLNAALLEGVQRHFRDTLERADFKPGDVTAGREYVKAYVAYMHFVERVYEALHTSPHGHFTEAHE
jgi:hypothetical protein